MKMFRIRCRCPKCRRRIDVPLSAPGAFVRRTCRKCRSRWYVIMTTRGPEFAESQPIPETKKEKTAQ